MVTNFNTLATELVELHHVIDENSQYRLILVPGSFKTGYTADTGLLWPAKYLPT